MSDVMRRKMFAVSVEPKADAMNVGIMSGFAEPSGNEYEEYEEDDQQEDMYEDRRPDNLEIIANNLRGDFKSLDSRYEELAMKVGPEAAMQTPPEVVALMQADMAQQMQGGIAALPQAQQAMPGATGAPPMPAAMPPGPPPMAQGPQQGMPPQAPPQMPQMANGGYIGKYQVGGSPAVQALSLGEQLRNAYIGSSGALPQMANIPQGPFADFLARSGQYGARLMQQAAPYVQSAGQNIRSAGSALGPYGRPLVIGGTALTAIPVIQALTGDRQGAAPSQMAPTAAQTVPMIGPDGRVVTDPAAYAAAVPAVDESMANARDVLLARGDMEAAASETAAPVPTTPIQPTTTIAAAPTPAEEETDDALFAKELAIREKRYADVLGGDKDYKQAQALFALADAGLKLASPMRGNLAARIAKAFENVPAALQKLGAEEEASRRAIKLAAIKGAEEAVASKAKTASAYAIAALKQNAKLGDIMIALRGMGITDPTTLQVAARGINSGVYKPESDDLGNVKIGPITIPGRDSRNAAAAQTSLQDNPLVVGVTPSKGRVPKALQKDVLTEKTQLESALGELDSVEKIVGDEKVFGPTSFFTGISNRYLVPVFGEGAPFANLSQESKASVAKAFKGRAARLAALSEKYPVYELKRLSEMFDNPETFFSDPLTFTAQVNAARANVMSRISGLDSQLYGTDAITYRPSPVGSKTDPFTIKDVSLLGEVFTRRPEAKLYFQKDPKSAPVLIDRSALSQ